MKHGYLFLLLATLPALAQTSFQRKQKTALPIPDLAQRLNATAVPLPASRQQTQTLLATGSAPLSVQPLRLRVLRDEITGLPLFIENRSNTPTTRNARRSAAAVTTDFLKQTRSLLQLTNPADQFVVSQTTTDDLGQTHLRLAQTYQGVYVYNSEMALHLNADGEVSLLNGRYQPVRGDVATTPRLSMDEATQRALSDVRKKSLVRPFGQNLLNMQQSTGNCACL